MAAPALLRAVRRTSATASPRDIRGASALAPLRTARRVLAAVPLAAALAASVAPPPACALVPDWSGSSAIVVTAPASGQISVSAPVSLSVALRGDGGVLEGSAVELRNLSTTPVAVANVRVAERNGARVVPATQVEATEGSDLLHLRLAVGASALDAATCLGAGAAPPGGEAWLADPGETLRIDVAGGFERPSATFRSTYADAEPVTACVVTWTVQAR